MLVSVIIPTLNSKREWLNKALGSCLFADEVIITREVGGITPAVNHAVELARGKYLSILPDDDFFLPEIDDIAEVLKAEDADVVHFPCKHWREEVELEGLFDVSPGVTLGSNAQKNTIFGSSFIKKSAFLEAGGYEGSACADARLFDRMLSQGKVFRYVHIPGAVFRWNSHSTFQRGR